jgi:hypothetical protein
VAGVLGVAGGRRSDLAIEVVNAAHVRAVPGRKTDVKDSQWLAQLMEVGLLRLAVHRARHGLLQADIAAPVLRPGLLRMYRSRQIKDQL